ncbi:MAG: S-layer homology domain-containing protein, partial [Caldimicrobium sp.]
VRAVEGENFSYNPNPYFQDVSPNHQLFKYIQRLKELGITKGCNSEGTLFCPDKPVTRAEMAVFFWRAWGGGN